MLRLICFVLCNLFLLISTIVYLDFLKIKKKNEQFIYGGIIYFFRIIVFELILGMIIKNLGFCTITALAFIEFLVLEIILRFKHNNVLNILKKSLIEIKKINYKIKFNLNTILFIIFVFVFCVMSFVAITVYEYSFDGNYYHLPHIIDYVQDGQIHITNNTLWNNVYPQNIELLNMFFLLFSRSIFGVRMPQLIFALIGMVSVYSLIKELNFSKNAAFRCSLLYFVAPFILAQITTIYLDGIVVTLFVLLLYTLIRVMKKNEFKYELLYFISLSIFMGTKGTCSIYAVIITSVYLVFKLINVIKKKEKLLPLFGKLCMFLLIVLVIGCTWMIQNTILFKNPLHPFKFLSIDGMDANIDIGVENEPFAIRGKNDGQKILISWLGLNSSYLTYDTGISISNLFQYHDSRIGGLGIQWMYFLIPITILSIYLVCRKRYKLTKYQIILLLILALSFAFTPANWWGRYVGFILVIGYIGYSIVDSCVTKKIIKYVIDAIYLIIFVFSIVFATKQSITILVKHEPYYEINYELREYINSEFGKNILFLEDSYYNTQYIAFLKGDKIQNKVNTYFINQMYPNEQLSNHNIGSYDNFTNIDYLSTCDSIIILDASKKRKNFEYAEKYYNTNKELMNKRLIGEDIIIYEKNK